MINSLYALVVTTLIVSPNGTVNISHFVLEKMGKDLCESTKSYFENKEENETYRTDFKLVVVYSCLPTIVRGYEKK